MQIVKKRDGRSVDFDKTKIENAIKKAFIEVDGQIKEGSLDIINRICEQIETSGKDFDVELIQDTIENKLMSSNRKDIAKAYMLYRDRRNILRESKKRKENILSIINNTNKTLREENSNKNIKLLPTQRDYMAGESCKEVSELFIPDRILKAHNEGIIHFHDMDYSPAMSMHNCSLINLEDMLQNGTVISEVKIDKPKKFSTACTIATQVITSVASNQYGGNSISLAHLSPFIEESRRFFKTEFDDLTDDQIERLVKMDIADGIQTIQYQLITMSTTNGQSPFTSLFMWINEVPEGRQREDLKIAINEVLKQRLKGVKNKKGVYVTTAFPKLLYVLDENNVHPGTEYWDLTKLSVECSTKRLVPDYISAKKMRELKDGHVFPVMGCRSALQPYYDENGVAKFYGRFNQGVVTLNLPDVALTVGRDLDGFYKLLDERLELCYDALMIRHKRLLGVTSDVAPILWQHGAIARLKPGEVIDKLLFNDYSSISLGYVGIYETVKALTGKSHTTEEGKKLAIEIMTYLNDQCAKWKKQTNIGFSLYGAPQESTTEKFANALRSRHGVILGLTDKHFVTNSYHVNVAEKIDAFSKLKFEGVLQALSTGGAVSYVETPNMEHNQEAVQEVVMFMYDHVMYAEVNTMTSYCHCCGGHNIKLGDDLKFYCPDCGNHDFDKMNIAVRVCGYISTNEFNEGRAEDIHSRVFHLGCD